MCLSQNQEQEFIGFSWRKGNKETSFTSLIQIFGKIQTMLFLRFRFLFEKANIIIYLFKKIFSNFDIGVQLINSVVIVPVGH